MPNTDVFFAIILSPSILKLFCKLRFVSEVPSTGYFCKPLQCVVEHGLRRNPHQYAHRCRRTKTPPENSLSVLENIQRDCKACTGCKSSKYSSRRIAHTRLRTYDSSRGKIQEAFQ